MHKDGARNPKEKIQKNINVAVIIHTGKSNMTNGSKLIFSGNLTINIYYT